MKNRFIVSKDKIYGNCILDTVTGGIRSISSDYGHLQRICDDLNTHEYASRYNHESKEKFIRRSLFSVFVTPAITALVYFVLGFAIMTIQRLDQLTWLLVSAGALYPMIMFWNLIQICLSKPRVK